METNLSFWWDLEKFSQKSVPSHTFLCCGEYLKFLRGLGKFRQKGVTSYTFFFAVQTILSFWWDLEKFSQKSVPNYTFCSLCRLSWVLDGTWRNFHKKVCPVICFFAVETNLSFWWDLEKFLQKSVPSHTFLRCGEYLKFLRGLGKFRQKGVTSYTIFFAVQTILSFWWDLEQFSQRSVPSYTFFRSACYFKFWIRLRKVSTKLCAQLHVFAVHAILSFG